MSKKIHAALSIDRLAQFLPRNKILKITLMITFVLLGTILVSNTKQFFSVLTILCEIDFPVKEIRVPGQIRTVLVKKNYEKPNSNQQKIILLWTTYFSTEYSDDFYFFPRNYSIFHRYNCEIKDCIVTSNRSSLPFADAILFHERDMNIHDIPRRLKTNQIWIIYCMEPPSYVVLNLNYDYSQFNWTMSYRSNSDVQVKYGEFVRRSNRSICADEKADKMIRTSKSKITAAAWLVSNCKTQSRREAYAKELKKHFKVDIFGRCTKRKCKPSQSRECYEMMRKYRYYLSFENSLCTDYVTEKFFNVLIYDVVPVVFGGAEYSRIAPPGSYIDATEFADPKTLADYLKLVAENETLYNSFFRWKEEYRVHLHPWMCELCRKIHEPLKPKTLPKDLRNWWISQAGCYKWTKEYGFIEKL